jgi:NADPH2 dehydrogenase
VDAAVTQFSYFISELKKRQPDLAFIHVVEPRVDGVIDRSEVPKGMNSDVFRDIWRPKPFISAGGFTRDTAIEFADKKGDLVAFGRHFISNVSIDYWAHPPQINASCLLYSLTLSSA